MLFYLVTKILVGGDNMVDLYVALIVAGRRTFSKIPTQLQPAVKETLEILGLDENGHPITE